MSTPVDLRVGGQNYRVLASTSEAELRRLAELVEERMRALTAPGRQVSPQTLVLAALALAHDLEEERAARRAVEERSREMLSSVLQRLDAILDEPATPVPPASGSAHKPPDYSEPSPFIED
ncbi:MAG TPA: cell division protein ZapA [Polyangiaceae bacterium]|nr:cell division protein ZapA [Polyangiaceae bacterium]